jgi:hypothetical protein
MMRRLLLPVLFLVAICHPARADYTFGPVVAQEYRFDGDTVKSTGLLTVGAFKYEAIPQWVTVVAFYGMSSRQYGENGQVAGAGVQMLQKDIIEVLALVGADIDSGWGALRYRENWFAGLGVAFNGFEFDLTGITGGDDGS